MNEQNKSNDNDGGKNMSGTKGGKQENGKKRVLEAVAQDGLLVVGTGACAAGATMAAIGLPTTMTIAGPVVAGLGLGGSLATIAGWFGMPIITTTTVLTAPVWAVPVAVAGGAVALGAVGWKLSRRRGKRKDGEKNAEKAE